MEMQTKELRKAAEFGTPLYVFHEEELRETTRRLENTLGKAAGLCYAMKANPFLVKVMEQLVDRIQKNEDLSDTKILKVNGIGNGYSNIFYFRKRSKGWELYKYEDTSI